MYDNEINFEFKADGGGNDYLGFEILLKCESRYWDQPDYPMTTRDPTTRTNYPTDAPTTDYPWTTPWNDDFDD